VTTRPGRLGRGGIGRGGIGIGIAEHCRFTEENPAVSKVFFRKKVNFRVLAELSGLVRHMVRQCHICAAVAGDPDPGSASSILPVAQTMTNAAATGGYW
jgi:hypothetical protein